jgi:3-oxoacyl-(acyl-carrier-protein) synthase
MTILVRGIGWLTNEGYGCVRTGLRKDYGNAEGEHSLPGKDIFSHPYKNFGRLDNISRMTAYAVALALRDAGIPYGPGKKQDIGIIGTNAEGSLRSDLEYFTDYVRSGRTLGRGNLFIYTLPSSPVGEAAIHFGFLGPLLYAAGRDASLLSVFDTAGEMLLSGETPVMLAGRAEQDEAVFFVLAGNGVPGNDMFCELKDARSIAEASPDVAGMVRKLSVMGAGG